MLLRFSVSLFLALCSLARRVMLEDSTTCSSHPAVATDTSSAASHNSSPGDGGDGGGPVAEGLAHSALSSAFASFSDVRKGLYELCLAQLAAARTPPPVGGGGGSFASGCSSEHSCFAAGTTPVGGCREVPPLAGMEEAEESGREAAAAEAGAEEEEEEEVRSRRVLAEGDEWVVREFRRVGAGVKAVRVVCRVRRGRLHPHVERIRQWKRWW